MTLALLVPGGTGQLGTDLAAAATAAGHDVTAPSSAELDISQAGQVVAAVRGLVERAGDGRRAVVVNAAAYTAVDAAEDDEAGAFAVNGDGPRLLAAACSSAQVPLVHVSTDYVFSGDAEQPYEPDDPLSPCNAYGRTKAVGEAAVLASGAAAWVVRTAWLYGAAGTNFVTAIRRAERARDTVSVVDDEYGTPTWSADLAAALLQLCARIADGEGPAAHTLHATGSGVTTRYEFARAIFEELGCDPQRVRPCSSSEQQRAAARPARAVLSSRSWTDAGLPALRDWRYALAEYLAADAD